MAYHRINNDEKKKLEFVLSAMDSNDIESKKLAVGILKTFPRDIKSIHYYNHQKTISKISLGALTYEYQVTCIDNNDPIQYYYRIKKYSYIKDELKRFIKHIIKNGYYCNIIL